MKKISLVIMGLCLVFFQSEAMSRRPEFMGMGGLYAAKANKGKKSKLRDSSTGERLRLSEWHFYNAINIGYAEWVEEHLENGFDPNYCEGDFGWRDSNPLVVFVRTFLKTDDTDKELSDNMWIFNLLR